MSIAPIRVIACTVAGIAFYDVAAACECRDVALSTRFAQVAEVLHVAGTRQTKKVGEESLSRVRIVDSFKGKRHRGEFVWLVTNSLTDCEGPTVKEGDLVVFGNADSQGRIGVSACNVVVFSDSPSEGSIQSTPSREEILQSLRGMVPKLNRSSERRGNSPNRHVHLALRHHAVRAPLRFVACHIS